MAAIVTVYAAVLFGGRTLEGFWTLNAVAGTTAVIILYLLYARLATTISITGGGAAPALLIIIALAGIVMAIHAVLHVSGAVETYVVNLDKWAVLEFAFESNVVINVLFFAYVALMARLPLAVPEHPVTRILFKRPRTTFRCVLAASLVLTGGFILFGGIFTLLNPVKVLINSTETRLILLYLGLLALLPFAWDRMGGLVRKNADG